MNSMDSRYLGAHASLFSKEVINNYQLINNIFMRKISTICMSLLMAVSLQVSAAGKTTVGQLVQKRLPQVPVSVPTPKAADNQQLGSAFLGMVKNAPTRVTDDPATQGNDSYGWVMGPDGYYWHYIMDISKELVRDTGSFKEYKYTGANVTMYDNYNKVVGTFNIEVPDTIFCNAIQVYGPVTKKLFDFSDKTHEVMVDIHHAKNGYSYDVTRAYTIETGEMKFDQRGIGIIFDASRNSYDLFQRLILTNENVKADSSFFDESEDALEAENTYVKIDIYSNEAKNGKFAREKNFFLDQNLNYYMQGSYLNCYVVDGEPYYVVAQFKEPWEEGKDPENPSNVIQRKDNPLILKTYGMVRPEGKYWKEITLVDSVAIDGNCPEGWQFRELGFGAFPYGDISLTKGYFTGDDQFNYIVLACDYAASKGDHDFATFYVYNSKGERVKEIIKEASSEWWKALAPVPGKEEQVAFLQTIGDGDAATDQITLVDLPSCKQVAVLPYMVEGNQVSTTLDRKPSNKNSYGYQYVVSLAKGESDSEDNVIAPIAWINPNGGIDHKDAMNLGKNGEYFQPLLNETTLNPYIFDTSDEMEYVYLAKKRRTDGSNKIDNVLEIASADGTVLKSFESNEERHIVEPSLVPVNADGKFQLAIVYENNTTGKYEMEFCPLPLNRFAEGGKGTKEDPYMVSTAGDLMQMGHEKKAYFKMAQDIDMTEAGLWEPVDNFQGELDGDGHSIFNMFVSTKSARAGLFGTLGYGGHAKNINFIKPTIELNSNTGFAGVVAGNCTADSLDGAMKNNPCENIHVMEGKIAGQGGAVIGGIIGQSTLHGNIVSCSYQGEINAPQASDGVGGIVGATFTGSSIYVCSSDIKATASAKLGGIIGEMSNECGNVYSCESKGTLTGDNTIGGIVGASSRAQTYGCINNCDIYANEPDKFDHYAVGGIVGHLDQDPYATETTEPGSKYVVYGNVTTGNIVLSGEKFDIAKAKENRAHMIVGYSSDDVAVTTEKYDKETDDWIVTVVGNAVEGGVHHNYTTVDTGAATDINSTDGMYKAKGEFNKEFMGNDKNFGIAYTYFDPLFSYGNTVEKPWKGDNIPVLYFNDEPKAITISAQDATLGLNAPDTYLKVVVYGVDDASDIDVVSSTPGVAEVSIESIEDNVVTVKVHALKQGLAVVNITYAGLSTSCDVTVLKEVVNGIENVETANDFQVSVANGYIAAEGAKTIQVYSVGGQLVAKSNGAAISTAQLAKGIYVVNATSVAGQKSTAKFVIK